MYVELPIQKKGRQCHWRMVQRPFKMWTNQKASGWDEGGSYGFMARPHLALAVPISQNCQREHVPCTLFQGMEKD